MIGTNIRYVGASSVDLEPVGATRRVAPNPTGTAACACISACISAAAGARSK